MKHLYRYSIPGAGEILPQGWIKKQMDRDDDLKTSRLLDAKRLFGKHDAHIAEGMFVPALIARITGSPEHYRAAEKALSKLKIHTTPGGAMRCDEWIKGRRGSADERYEYCGIAEMVGPLGRIISLTGDLEVADRIETMVHNAGQGARLPVLKALSYLTSDNRIRINHCELGGREAYDAVHLAAACCVLNGGRVMPYFVESMWMRDTGGGLTASLFGPCRIETEMDGVGVGISEETSYPFSDHIRFRFAPQRPVRFPFSLRKPHGCVSVEVSHPPAADMHDHENRISIHHRWKKGDTVDVRFHFRIRRVKQPASSSVPGKGMYLKRGSLVYAFPFAHRITPRKEYRGSGFFRYRIRTTDKRAWKYRLRPDANFQFVHAPEGSPLYPWERPVVKLRGPLVGLDGKEVQSELVPMGNTVFRRVTFAISGKE